MGSTSYLNLFTYNVSDDEYIGFDELRANINGSGSSSDMNRIDVWALQQSLILPAILSSFSGSNANISGSLNSIDTVLANTGSQITDFATRFEVLGTFSGSGQADFNSISQDYTHLVIMGVTSVDYPYYLANIGCDFNGTTTSASYETVQCDNSGSILGQGSTNNTETISSSAIGQLILGKTTGNLRSGYGGTLIGIIPNYSENGGFYKTSMGFDSLLSGSYISTNGLIYPEWFSVNINGGTWKSNVPITRIRIFGSSGSSKYDFLNGTEFTLYGFQ